MYRLLVCAASWLVLLGSLAIAWSQLPRPHTSSDIVVIAVIAAAAVTFARLGLVSLAALLLRILPSGRIRSALAAVVVRVMPRLLASSVLAVVSAGLVVQAAHATPAQEGRSGPMPHPPAGAEPVAAASADPAWPTSKGPPPAEPSAVGADDPQDTSPAAPTAEDTAPAAPTSAPADRGPRHDPAWPTAPPDSSASPESTAPAPMPEGRQPDRSGPGPDGSETQTSPAGPRKSTHEVADGDSLWSIATGFAEDSDDIPELVDDIYIANRETIGPDPSLIIAGQRLEIRP